MHSLEVFFLLNLPFSVQCTDCVCVCRLLQGFLDALCLAGMNGPALLGSLTKSLRCGAVGKPEPHTNGRLLYLS